MSLVWKLLRENISKPQLIGFFLANLIGMSIVLLAIQFYFDISPIFSEKDNLFKKEYLTITKKVGLLSSISTKTSGFTELEVDDLKKQLFVKDVGAFTPSQFNILAGISAGDSDLVFKTEMFFESVPDYFIDVKSDEWHFSPQDEKIPIILPKNYLDLYNFGFAEANSMPKISEGLIGMLGLDISIYGKNGQRKQMTGRIVGFSNRINTILVPESFMTWANQSFGSSRSFLPSRLILEINNIADPNLANYFKDRGYQISGENSTASKMSFFLKIVVTIVISVGIVICLLSFFILVLSIYLLLEKNMGKLRTLRLVGYSKSFVVRPYELLVVVINIIILIASLVVVFIVRAKYLEYINKIYSSSGDAFPIYTYIIGVSIFILLSLFNIFIIRNKVK